MRTSHRGPLRAGFVRTSVEHLGTVTVSVSAFDAFDNPIPVPPSTTD